MAEARDTHNDVESVEFGDRVFYWRVRTGDTLKSDLAKHLTKARYGDVHTGRRINTLREVLDHGSTSCP
jgi:hypothetical protein